MSLPRKPGTVLLTHIPTLDAVLRKHEAVLGRDFEAYRNHAYRVANLCAAQSSGSPEEIEKIAIVSAFHDLGIWTDRTFDYLSPSASLARGHLTESGHAGWIPEITAAILEHHKISRYRGNDGWVVEPFRRADWMDVSMGLISFGLSGGLFETVVATWPRAGFHKLLARLELRRLRTNPWSPLPMVRL